MIKTLDYFLCKFNQFNLRVYFIILSFLFFSTWKLAVSQVTDIEGYTYPTVIIGEQEWMAENLKTGYFNNGTPIPLLISGQDWISSTDAGTCWYNNDSTAHHQIYGRMYNGYAALDSNICPEGWRVPTEQDWDVLLMEIGGSMFAGGSLKIEGTEYWEEPNTGATNSSGFSAYPSGWRSNADGSFNWLGQRAGWFVTIRENSDVAFRFVSWSMAAAGSGAIHKNAGLCIRCMRYVANSIEEEATGTLMLYPNPAEDYIEIIQPSEGSVVKIYNTLGEIVMELPDVAHLGDVAHFKRIDISYLPAGLYFIKFGNYSQIFMVIR